MLPGKSFMLEIPLIILILVFLLFWFLDSYYLSHFKSNIFDNISLFYFLISDVQSLLSIGNLISLDDIEDQNSEDHDDEEEEEDSEKEDDEIKPTDNLIAVGRVNGDTSFLEVYGLL